MASARGLPLLGQKSLGCCATSLSDWLLIFVLIYDANPFSTEQFVFATQPFVLLSASGTIVASICSRRLL